MATAAAGLTTANASAASVYRGLVGPADALQTTDDANAVFLAIKTTADALLLDATDADSAIDVYSNAESVDYDQEQKDGAQALETLQVNDADGEASAIHSEAGAAPSPWLNEMAAQALAAAAQIDTLAPAQQTLTADLADALAAYEKASADANQTDADALAKAWHDQTIADAQADQNQAISSLPPDPTLLVSLTPDPRIPTPAPGDPATLSADFGFTADVNDVSLDGAGWSYSVASTSEDFSGLAGTAAAMSPDLVDNPPYAPPNPYANLYQLHLPGEPDNSSGSGGGGTQQPSGPQNSTPPAVPETNPQGVQEKGFMLEKDDARHPSAVGVVFGPNSAGRPRIPSVDGPKSTEFDGLPNVPSFLLPSAVIDYHAARNRARAEMDALGPDATAEEKGDLHYTIVMPELVARYRGAVEEWPALAGAAAGVNRETQIGAVALDTFSLGLIDPVHQASENLKAEARATNDPYLAVAIGLSRLGGRAAQVVVIYYTGGIALAAAVPAPSAGFVATMDILGATGGTMMSSIAANDAVATYYDIKNGDYVSAAEHGADTLVDGTTVIYIVGKSASTQPSYEAPKPAPEGGPLVLESFLEVNSSGIDLTNKGPIYNISTSGRTSAERGSIILYGQRANAWRQANGPVVVRATKGTLRSQASAQARLERLRAARAGQPYQGKAGQPYQGKAGHVPDTALSNNPVPPAGWLDMLGESNSVAGGGLSSRIGQRVIVIFVDARLP